jgi:alpha-beta hydrolase superfamily lysophospholipase
MRSAAQRSRITGDEARPGRDVANPPAIPIFPRTAPNPGRRAKESPHGDGHLPRHTSIYFDRLGEGPPVVLISGGSVDRSSNAGLAAELAGSGFTDYNYDRRGRGDSGDTQPYAIEREVEDIAAVIEAAGGRAHLYGSSSGAALGMHAAAAGLPITKLAMWEPPYSVNGRPDLPADTASVYRELVATGRRGDAAEYFMAKVVGMPPEFVAQARQAPWWPRQEALAHTPAYDAEVMGDYTIPAELARSVPVPTLILIGGASFGFFGPTADALVELIPDARRQVLEGQQHDVDPTALARPWPGSSPAEPSPRGGPACASALPSCRPARPPPASRPPTRSSRPSARAGAPRSRSPSTATPTAAPWPPWAAPR